MKRHRFKKGVILLLVFLINTVLFLNYKDTFINHDDRIIDDENEMIENNYGIQLEDLASHNILMIDADTKEVIVSKNAKSRMHPASLTKLMSVLIALDYYNDLNQMLVVQASDLDPLIAQQASLAGFSEYDEVSVIDLLYGALVPSGADAIATLVHNITSEEEFVEMMNQRAQQLGMQSTHYTNVYGFHDDNHYTSASDMMILFEEALSHSVLKAIMSTDTYYVASGHNLSFESTIFSRINHSNGYMTETLTGGKTGYTPQAGQCLASFGSDNYRNYLIVSGAALGDNFTEPFHIQDHLYLYQSFIDY